MLGFTFLLNIRVGIPQNIDSTVKCNPSDSNSDEQVRPIGICPDNDDSCQNDPAIGDEIVNAEGRCSAEIYILLCNLLSKWRDRKFTTAATAAIVIINAPMGSDPPK